MTIDIEVDIDLNVEVDVEVDDEVDDEVEVDVEAVDRFRDRKAGFAVLWATALDRLVPTNQLRDERAGDRADWIVVVIE